MNKVKELFSSAKEYSEENPKIPLFLTGIAVTALIGLIGKKLYDKFTGPMYVPGSLKFQEISVPENHSQIDDKWLVEDGEKRIELHHFSSGQGRNVLIVHGGPGKPYSEAWTGLKDLESEYQFHYYDQRGCGQSTRPFDRFDQGFFANMTLLEDVLGFGSQVADIERIRLILGEEKLIIIGHSFGGLIASLYAAEFPEHVEKLVLVCPAPMIKMPSDFPDIMQKMKSGMPESSLSDYEEFLSRYLDFKNIFSKSETDLIEQDREFQKFISLALLDEIPESDILPGGWMVFAMFFSMGRKHDYTQIMTNLATPAPTLIIHADQDSFQDEEATQTYLPLFQNASFHSLPNSNHWPFLEQPESFSQILTTFLK